MLEQHEMLFKTSNQVITMSISIGEIFNTSAIDSFYPILTTSIIISCLIREQYSPTALQAVT